MGPTVEMPRMSEFDADYVITHVRYVGHHIDAVRRHRPTDDGLGDPVEVPRDAVVQDLDLGLDYATAFHEDGDWIPGDEVITYHADGERFIRTTGDDHPEDNLSGLPEF